jgi:nitroreductase
MSAHADIDMILKRRSARRFLPGAVDDEDLGTIIEAGLSAPSSKNSQPWYIAVARGRTKDEICEWVEENPEGLPTVPGELLIAEPAARPEDSTPQSLRYVRAAPVLLLIFNRAPFTGGKERAEDDIRHGKRVSYESEYVSLGACMQNMLLAARALDLGAIAVMDILPAAPMIRQRLGIDYDLVIGIALGRAEETPSPKTVDQERFVRYFD